MTIRDVLYSFEPGYDENSNLRVRDLLIYDFPHS
jgi:hypothetical protein